MSVKKMFKTKPLLATLSLAAAFMLGLGHGCGEFRAASNALSGVSGDPSAASGGDDDAFPIIDNEKTAATVYANQALDNMVSCLGLTRPSAKTIAEFESRKGAISETGSPTRLTAPMMMAITAVAAEVCDDFLVQEKATAAAQRRVYLELDFNSTNPMTRPDMTNMLRRLSRSCWQRNPTAEEESMVIPEMDAVQSAAPNRTTYDNRTINGQYNAAMSMCTLVLSSLSGVSR